MEGINKTYVTLNLYPFSNPNESLARTRHFCIFPFTLKALKKYKRMFLEQIFIFIGKQLDGFDLKLFFVLFSKFFYF